MIASVFDVAAYITQQYGGMTCNQLNRMCCLSHCHHLGWQEEPLFSDSIEAWRTGFFVPNLFFALDSFELIENVSLGHPGNLSDGQKESIDIVYDFYKDYDLGDFETLYSNLEIYTKARQGLSFRVRRGPVIDPIDIKNYFQLLQEQDCDEDC